MATRGPIKSIHSVEHAALCEVLRSARLKAGLTQAELAKRLKRPQSFVAKYEGGERRLDVIEFVTVSRMIGTDPMKNLRSLLKQLK